MGLALPFWEYLTFPHCLTPAKCKSANYKHLNPAGPRASLKQESPEQLSRGGSEEFRANLGIGQSG
jgi:hypothetical protein